MIRGWTSSSSIDRRRSRAFSALAEARAEVARSGRQATAQPVTQGSFYTRPHDVPQLAAFDDGVAAALRAHLIDQGLTDLADKVDEFESLGRRLGQHGGRSETVSELVYEMH